MNEWRPPPPQESISPGPDTKSTNLVTQTFVCFDFNWNVGAFCCVRHCKYLLRLRFAILPVVCVHKWNINKLFDQIGKINCKGTTKEHTQKEGKREKKSPYVWWNGGGIWERKQKQQKRQKLMEQYIANVSICGDGRSSINNTSDWIHRRRSSWTRRGELISPVIVHGLAALCMPPPLESPGVLYFCGRRVDDITKKKGGAR